MKTSNWLNQIALTTSHERARNLGKKLGRSNQRRSNFGSLESLEQRSMMAGDIFAGENEGWIAYESGTVSIHGTNEADTATATVQWVGPVPLLHVTLNNSFGNQVKVYNGFTVQQLEFFGHDGNDKFTNATYFASTAEGGTGADTLIGGSNIDTLKGNGGHDLLSGGSGNDNLYGGFGNDVINGGNGNDILDGHYGHDELNGNDGHDQLDGDFGNDTLRGGNGNDTATGDSGSDKMYGNGGNDTMYGGGGKDSMQGGGGNDVMHGGDADDWMTGQSGNDKLYGNDGGDTMYGYTGDDSLQGGNGNDVLSGWDGDDWMTGQSGDDKLYGHAGNDTMYGYTGDDSLQGGSGNDTLSGWEGNDWMTGQSGHDKLYGHAGNDTMYGYTGNDSLQGGSGNDILSGWTGNDWMTGQSGHDKLYGHAGNDTMYGYTGNDSMYGGSGNDMLSGWSGHDNLYGHEGDDQLYGHAGRDGLAGGNGTDVINGGSGADRHLTVSSSDADESSINTKIHFRSKDAMWTYAEIEAVDAALAMLHHRTGTTELLQNTDDSDLTIYRQVVDESIDCDDDPDVTSYCNVGTNHGNGTITLNDPLFDGMDTDKIIQFTIHEIAHSWQSQSVNSQWNDFKDLSDWRNDLGTGDKGDTQMDGGVTYVKASGGNWWYRQSADFVSNYAKTRPGEDWADSVAAAMVGNKFAYRTGNTIGTSDWPDSKIDVVNDWLDSI